MDRPLLRSRLASRQLLVVTGKGGVGKSTLAAALGLSLARSGTRVLLLEADPRESLYPLLGVEPSGGKVVPVLPGLFVQNLRPQDVLDRIVREQLGIELISRRVLASPVYRQFAEGAPGLKEIAILGHALRVVRGLDRDGLPEVDLVILDAPATGHGVSLLAAPTLVAEVIHDGPFARMGSELATFIGNAERCAVLLATLAEEMPVQEAIELIATLDRRLDRRPELVLVNALYPRLDESAGKGELVELWRRRREVNDRELARLEQAWSGPRIDLPLLPLDRGPELLAALSERLDRMLVAP